MTDRTDSTKPASSEELIRQARSAYEPESVSEIDASGRPTGQPTPGIRHDASDADRYEPTARPTDYLKSEYQDQSQGTVLGGATTYEEKRPPFLSRFGGLLVIGAIVLGFIVYSAFDKTKSIDDLAVGDCLLMPSDEEIRSVESTDCAEGHELEVFALVTLPDADSAPYPGDFVVAESIFNSCLPSFQSYIGASFDSSIWYINAIYPTQASWEDADDRSGTCVVYQPGVDDEPITLTGSARGSAE